MHQRQQLVQQLAPTAELAEPPGLVNSGRCAAQRAADPGLDVVVGDLGSDRFLDQAEVVGEGLAYRLMLGAVRGGEGVVVDAHRVSFRGAGAGHVAGPT